MERITSKSNNIIKDVKRLLTSSKERAEKGLFVLEGARLCLDVLNSVFKPVITLVTQDALDRYGENAERLCSVSERAYVISKEVAEKLSDTESAQGFFTVCKKPEPGGSVEGKRIIALDRVQDPSNIGAVIRSAEALGIDGIITCSCCDVFNPKALRASMGGALRMNIADTDDLVQTLEAMKDGYRVYATVPDSSAKPITEIDFSHPCVCVIGNEANGVSEDVKRVSDALITIPMSGRAESLNASVAAALTMWEMLR